MPTKLVILDRDGVINFDSAQFIKSPDEWKPIPGSLEAIARLKQNGYRMVVATNQSGVGRGLFDMDTLNQIHAKMHKAVVAVGGQIDAIFYCPHAADSKCDCRKPKPGMFKRISETLQHRPDRRAGHRRLVARPAGLHCPGLPAGTGHVRQGRKDKGRGQPAGGHAGIRGSGQCRRSSSRQGKEMNAIRSSLFMVYAIVWSIFAAPPVVIGAILLGGIWGYRLGKVWRLGMQWGIENLLGIRPKVIGQENMPKEPCVILAKHQSAWETMALQDYTWGAYCVFVLKKELLQACPWLAGAWLQ